MGNDADIDQILAAFAADTDEELIGELRRHRSGPGVEFDEALDRLAKRIRVLRDRSRYALARGR